MCLSGMCKCVLVFVCVSGGYKCAFAYVHVTEYMCMYMWVCLGTCVYVLCECKFVVYVHVTE